MILQDKGKEKKPHRKYANTPHKCLQIFLSIMSIVMVFLFGIWWFNPAHIPHNFSGLARIVDVILFLSVSYVIWHSIVMDVLTWSIALHIRDLRKQKPAKGLKVAFITTIVPGKESLTLLHKCLPAMMK